MQTPVLRHTDRIPAYEPPEEKSIVWTVLAALVLVGVIGFGAYKLKPILYDVRHPEVHNQAVANAAVQPPNAATTATSNAADTSAQQPDATATTAQTSQPSAQTQAQPNAATEKSDSQSTQQNTAQNSSDAATAPTNSATQATQTVASEKVTPEKTPTAVAAVEKTDVAQVKNGGGKNRTGAEREGGASKTTN